MPAEFSLESISRSKAAANNAVKSLTVEQIERAIANLSAAAKIAQQRDALKAQRKKEVAVKKLKSMMNELGISADDIADTSKAKPIKRKSTGPKKVNKVAPKYQITVNGVAHQWTGRGRTPVVFKDHVAQGGALDDCLI
ncbi:MAG: H-NS histone family protein [Halieaceae bacterium]|nr:H-NS histone family protein [Halieaceae bacterium]